MTRLCLKSGRLLSAWHLYHAAGANLVMSVILLMIILVFAGMVTYMGINGYLSEEAQNAVSTAALAGAGAFYETTDADGQPTLSAGQPQVAATATFNGFKNNSPTLQSFEASLQPVVVDAANYRVTVSAKSQVDLPFLGLIGLDGLTLNHAFMAQGAKYIPPGFPVRLGGAGGGSCGGTDPTQKVLDLVYPLTDRPGVDLRVTTTSQRGYFLLGCSGGDCWDLGGAARPLNGGALRATTLPNTSQPAQAIYGSATIDLASTSPGYNGNVRKASQLMLLDDGVPDRYINGQHMLELCPPAGPQIDRIEIFHQASACVTNAGFCILPKDMYPLP